MKSKILAWIIVLVLLLHLVAALGIRPAKSTVAFEQYANQAYNGRFWVVNNDLHSFSVKVHAEGEMGQYIAINQTELNFREDDDALPVDFKVNLPSAVPPGISTANIIIEEKLDSAESNVISSKLVLKHKIAIEGPYPDKYIKTELNFNDNGDKVKLILEVENFGRKPIDKIYTTFYVNNKKQEQRTITTETSSLFQKENKLLTAEIDKAEVAFGEFEVAAVTAYDDQKVEVSKKMIIGSPEVDVTYFDKYFVADKINPYTMELLNKWNKKVENVYVDVEVSKGGQRVDSFRTKSVDIDSEARKRINDYLDARSKGSGSYAFDMVVNFWNTYKMDKKTFHSELIGEKEYSSLSPEEAGSNAVGEAAGAEGKANNAKTAPLKMFAWLFAGILASALGSFIAWRYIHRKEYE